MNWRQALFSRRTLGVRLGLEAVAAVDEALGRPCRETRIVQIVGTNGKGSTAAMLAHGLWASGRRVGLYTSPHLHRVGERVRVDGEPVRDEVIEVVTERVVAAEGSAGRPLSFFEVLTLAALLVFAEAQVEVVVLEAGLGGRLDATSVRVPSLTLVTRIALDHQAYLGDSLTAIAEEKAAVMRAGVPCFTTAQEESVMAVLGRRAAEVGAPLRTVEALVSAPLPGKHQLHNAALALAGLRWFEPGASRELLDGAVWPARLEERAFGGGRVLLDVAHNLDGIVALVDHLRDRGRRPDAIVFGCMADKDVSGMLAQLEGLGCPLWLVPPPHDGAMRPPAHVPATWRCFSGPFDPEFTAARARLLGRGGELVACGSHFLVAALRAQVLGMGSDAVDPAALTDPVLRK